MNTERYQRQLVLPDFGSAGQEKLLNSSVLIVGAGGLGVPVLQYLAGMGVGKIGIVDGDTIALSNLQRQVMYTTGDVGKKKVEVAQNHLRQLNPEVEIVAVQDMLTRANAASTIEGYDLVIDCTDSIESRYIISDTCEELGLAFVYGALYRHEGHVSVFNYQGSPTYRDVYPDDSAKVDNCNEIGVLGVLPGLIGMFQAIEAVKILAEIGESIAGKLLVIDPFSMEHHLFGLSKSSVNKKRETVSIEESWLTWDQIKEIDLTGFHMIDVRTPEDYAAFHDQRFENIPVNDLISFSPENGKEVLLVCNKGITTRQASMIIKSSYPDIPVHQVTGGYSTL